MSTHRTEAKLAGEVALWLRLTGWEVYAEVDQIPGRGRARADLVATKPWGDSLCVNVIECKLRLSFDAIGQARAWLPYAEAVWIATARCSTGRALEPARAAVEAAGLGWLYMHDGEAERIVAAPAPQMKPRTALLLDALRPEHALARPGTAGGSRPWTEWDERSRRLAEVVAAEPGVELRRALDLAEVRLDADGRRALVRQIRHGVIAGVSLRREGRRVFLSAATEGDTF